MEINKTFVLTIIIIDIQIENKDPVAQQLYYLKINDIFAALNIMKMMVAYSSVI